MAGIAHWDWPDQWPNLFDILMEAMRAQDEFAVQGAVRVLKELARDLSDSQVLPSAQYDEQSKIKAEKLRVWFAAVLYPCPMPRSLPSPR